MARKTDHVHDDENRLSLSPPPTERQTIELRERKWRGPSPSTERQADEILNRLRSAPRAAGRRRTKSAPVP